ncbi:hypothetical protein J7T55_010634 [Diaporthe amygdali]|uniref:uncharacterized protein n=1 Tax=Phomopsis amygdali TaxID=1214568 RepID=UPI0022FDDC95|nr:uncharacterized protein J7T55_010634 [Diaporthe amygdali]KAJ0114247.1 hypothetical protein J7T55_010634 [Diaporthe amygdali]
MADPGPRLVAAAYPSPPNQHRHRHYSPSQSHSSQDSPSSRRKPSNASLSDQPYYNMATTSLSPPNIKNEFGGVGTGIAYGGPAHSNPQPPSEKNGTLGFGFLKSLTSSEKKLTRDGQPAKRRGPKPDSKPALTRRQELNRQAQRTHRERKELYIKALEDEVLRLKEVYSNVSQDKERLAEENRTLKAVMQQNGLPVSGTIGMMDDNISSPSVGPYIGSNSSASMTGSGSYGLASASTQNSAYTPPPGSALSTTTAMQGLSPLGGLSPSQQAVGLHRQSPSAHLTGPRRNPGIDYDQAGVDFVLSLERPCMDHMPWLLDRSSANGGTEPCGHALMASCPPEPFSDLTPDIPFGHKHSNNTPGTNGHSRQTSNQRNPSISRNFSRNHAAPSSQVAERTGMVAPNSAAMEVDGPTGGPPRTWELSKSDLATLLDLSQKLNLDGEITPVMAWGMVLAHPRLGEMNEKDFVKLTEELGSKIRCYGFGAVTEEFEVRDALEAIFSTKPEQPMGLTGVAPGGYNL